MAKIQSIKKSKALWWKKKLSILQTGTPSHEIKWKEYTTHTVWTYNFSNAYLSEYDEEDNAQVATSGEPETGGSSDVATQSSSRRLSFVLEPYNLFEIV